MSACGEGSGLSYVDSKREILFCFYEFFPTFSSLVIKEMQIKTKVVFFPPLTIKLTKTKNKVVESLRNWRSRVLLVDSEVLNLPERQFDNYIIRLKTRYMP